MKYFITIIILMIYFALDSFNNGNALNQNDNNQIVRKRLINSLNRIKKLKNEIIIQNHNNEIEIEQEILKIRKKLITNDINEIGQYFQHLYLKFEHLILQFYNSTLTFLIENGIGLILKFIFFL